MLVKEATCLANSYTATTLRFFFLKLFTSTAVHQLANVLGHEPMRAQLYTSILVFQLFLLVLRPEYSGMTRAMPCICRRAINNYDIDSAG